MFGEPKLNPHHIMEYLKCTGIVEKAGGEIRNLKLLGMPHAGEVISQHVNGDDYNHYEIINVEHCSGNDAPLPYVLLLLRPMASGLV